MIGGLLFDLDGTLLDTLDSVTRCADLVLDRHALARRSRDEYRRAIGRGPNAMFAKLAASGGGIADDIVASCARAMVETFPTFWPSFSKPYPGISRLLRRLCEHEIPCGVISNRNHDTVSAMLARFFDEIPWRVVAGSGMFRDKPDPAACLFAARNLRLDPAQVVLVGDTEVDVAAAHNAGMRSVAVSWGFRDRDELLAAGAPIVVDTPERLEALLMADVEPRQRCAK